MILYYIRHGSTESNIKYGICGARIDWPLASDGIYEIEKYVQEKIYPARADIFFCSEMSRTQQTLKIIYPKEKYHITTLLNERDLGQIEYERDAEKVKKWKDTMFDKNGQEYPGAMGDGEDQSTFLKRVARDFHSLLKMASQNKYESMVICGHGAYLRYVAKVYDIEGIKENQMLIKNGQGVILKAEQDENGVFHLSLTGFIQ